MVCGIQAIDKEEVVVDRFPSEKHLLVALPRAVMGAEMQISRVIIACAKQGQAIDDSLLGLVLQRLVDSKHVFAKGTAVAVLINAAVMKDQVTAWGEKERLLAVNLTNVMMGF